MIQNTSLVDTLLTKKEFFEFLDLLTAFEHQSSDEVDGYLQVVLEPRSELTVPSVNGYPVIPLDKTLAYMYEHYAQFQPAISMVEKMYDDPLPDRSR